jgi:hypothetical protein
MGNIIPYYNIISYYKINQPKELSNILKLEGWILKYKNDNLIYFNQYTKKETEDYPDSISDYNDIYNFYKTELLNSKDTLILLELILLQHSLSEEHSYFILLEEDVYKINEYISLIKTENNLNEIDTHFILSCCT